MSDTAQIWDLWVPGIGSQGLSFARGRMAAADVVLVHAAPESLDVEVRSDDGTVVAQAKELRRTVDTPICRLTVSGGTLTREDIWPGPDDIGRPVVMMGGEIGILTAWWNAEDEQEWRWSVELYNHR